MYLGVLAVVGWLVSDKQEWIVKEVYVPKPRYHPCVCLEGLRKTTKKLRVTNVFFSPIPSPVPYGLRGLPSRLWPKCNRLLRLEHRLGAVTLSRWDGWWYTGWLKKTDSISYVYISWTIHGMWIIYITFERGGPKFSNTTTRTLA
jgi:hypothetical protein